jgi:hypothetical protein
MSIFTAFPIAKIVYTTVLMGLIAILAREIYSIWWDRGLYVGQFSYFIDGKADDEQSKAFPSHILGQHQLLRSALIEERRRRIEARSVSTPVAAEIYTLPSSLPEIARWQTVLSDIELKIQGFDLGKLLQQLRSSINPPDEINGFVEKTGNVVRAGVNWPNRRMTKAASVDAAFQTGDLSGESAAAFSIAASVIWAQAADADSEFAKVPRDTFVSWALTWWDYRQIRGREAIGEQLSDEDKKRWTQARRLVDNLVSQAAKYPEIWRLRADLIDAAPEGAATDQDKATAREDRNRYSVAMGLAPVTMTAVVSHGIPPAIVVRPGSPIWARAASTLSDAPFTISCTVTAIVLGPSGTLQILLPAYAILSSNTGSETEFATSPAGPIVARASDKDIIYNGSPKEGAGVALATLKEGSDANNALVGDGPLKAVGPVPLPGTTIKLYSPGQSSKSGQIVRTGTIERIEGPFVVTDARVTQPGDAGAPAVNANGELIAMGYRGTDKESQLLSVNWLFQEAGIRLAQ